MNKKKIAIFVMFNFGLMPSCQSNGSKLHKANTVFVSKFGDDNYTHLRGWEFFLRGYDNGNPIVFVYDHRTEKSHNCSGPLVVTVNKKTYALVKTMRNALDDSCTIDERLSYSMAVEFLKYNLTMLSVDKSGNVEAKVFFQEHGGMIVRGEKPNLGKKSIWQPLGKGWYEQGEE